MNRSLSSALLAASLTGFGISSASAQVVVKDAWVRATVAQQKATGAFMQISSAVAGRLVEVKSTVADSVELHEMAMDGNVMKMRAVPGVDLPAGQPVELKPGGYHVMLMGLKQPLKDGDSVPLTLVFEAKDKVRQTIEVLAPVRPLNAAMPTVHKH